MKSVLTHLVSYTRTLVSSSTHICHSFLALSFMTIAGGLVTASGYASMLEEPNAQLQAAALVEISKVCIGVISCHITNLGCRQFLARSSGVYLAD